MKNRKYNDNYLFLLLYYKNKFGIKTEKIIIKQNFSQLLIHVLIHKIYAYVRYFTFAYYCWQKYCFQNTNQLILSRLHLHFLFSLSFRFLSGLYQLRLLIHSHLLSLLLHSSNLHMLLFVASIQLLRFQLFHLKVFIFKMKFL